MRLRRPLPAVQGDTLHIVGVGDNRIGKAHWLGLKTTKCFSFALFCEDDEKELHRRQIDICNGLIVPISSVGNMAWKSGVGEDNVLMNFDQRKGDAVLTDRFRHLMDVCKKLQPGLVILDTLADTFGGNEIIRNQVRTFINGCLGLICKEIGATVILCGHPSQSGLSSGSGYSGSTAWNNSVRSRLYLSKPTEEDAEPTERILTTKKSNYGPSGDAMELHWSNGLFKPVEKFSGMVGHIEESNHEKTFIKCLDILTERGTAISDSTNSSTYAPKIMAKMPERERMKRRKLEKAMFSLFSKGDIVNEPYGPPSRLRSRIARKPSEGGNDDDA